MGNSFSELSVADEGEKYTGRQIKKMKKEEKGNVECEVMIRNHNKSKEEDIEKTTQTKKYEDSLTKMIKFMQEAIVFINDNNDLYMEGNKMMDLISQCNQYLKYFENQLYHAQKNELDEMREKEIDSKIEEAKKKFSEEMDLIDSK